MSRLYGRVEDLYRFYDYLDNNYKQKYKKDKTIISREELENAPSKIFDYLNKDYVKYLNNCDIKIYWNNRSKDVMYSLDDDNHCIFFPTKKMIEDYKIDLVFYMGDILNGRKLDYMSDDYDTKCQFSNVVPLLLQHAFFKESGKEERFVIKNMSEISLNAPIYIKHHDKFIKNPLLFSEDLMLRETLLNLVAVSSFDAALQIIDKYGNDKNEMRLLLSQLIENEYHNREEIINDRGIETYGFKRLRKEIDLRK